MYQYINKNEINFMSNTSEKVWHLIAQFKTWVPKNRKPGINEFINLSLVAGQLKIIFMENEELAKKHTHDIDFINEVLNNV